ncbi:MULTISPECIES: hypothetical protein [unclassified Streptomyces]|uniref:hypothetical protein n=1 Tax=unclassified Streptomyces TaxID=2593676 RepID=UPI0033B48A7C
MLRIADTRTGRLVEVPSARRHLLRLCVHLPAAPDGPGAADLRVPLVGDLLARTAELHGLQSHTVLTAPGPAWSPERSRDLDRALAALGVHPPAVTGTPPTTDAACAAADVHVHARGEVPEVAGGVPTEVGAGGAVPPGLLDAAAAPGRDPLAVRLLLLGRPHAAPVTLDEAALDAAGRTLAHWRRQVAEWAREPSRPVPAEVLRDARERLADDLAVPAVLALLTAVAESADVPPGARFETFALLDRVLGLDLAREVGS